MFGIQFKIHTLTPLGDEDDYTFVGDYDDVELLAQLMEQCLQETVQRLLAQLMEQCIQETVQRHPCPANYTPEDWNNSILAFADA